MPALPCPATRTNARRSLSDNDQSDGRMLARPATMWSLKTDSSRNLFLERTASLSKLHCDPAREPARCASMVIHLAGEKHAMGQTVNAIRYNEKAENGGRCHGTFFS